MEKLLFNPSFSKNVYTDICQLKDLKKDCGILNDCLVQTSDELCDTFIYDSESKCFTKVNDVMEVKLPSKKWGLVGARVHFKQCNKVYTGPFTLKLDNLRSSRQEASSDGFQLNVIYNFELRMQISDSLTFLEKRTRLDVLLSYTELLHTIERASTSTYTDGAAIKEKLAAFLKPYGVKVLFASAVKKHESFNGMSDQQRANNWNNTLQATNQGIIVDRIKTDYELGKKRKVAQNDAAIQYGKGQVEINLQKQHKKMMYELFIDFVCALPREMRKSVGVMAIASKYGIKISEKTMDNIISGKFKNRAQLSHFV